MLKCFQYEKKYYLKADKILVVTKDKMEFCKEIPEKAKQISKDEFDFHFSTALLEFSKFVLI